MVDRIAVIVDRPVAGRYAGATLSALHHALADSEFDAVAEEVPTAAIDASSLEGVVAVVVGPGSPYNRPDLVFDAIRTAREQGLPLVGT